MTTTKRQEIQRFIKFAIFRIFNKLFCIILPTYRIAKVNQKILIHNNLMLQDLRRENMPIDTGERLVSEEEDADNYMNHIKRYEFAKTLIKDDDEVLDIACGVGYGSYAMAENKKANFTGVDISTKAIEHANKNYKKENIEFICCRAEDFQPKKKFDVIISFETIEHLENDKKFITDITKHLKQGGLFICSTPNELNMPYSIFNHPFHYRHYTPRKMSRILTKSGGLKIEAIYTQRPIDNYELTKSRLGILTVHVARKK